MAWRLHRVLLLLLLCVVGHLQCSRCVPGVAYRNPFNSMGHCVMCSSAPKTVLATYLAATAGAGLLLYLMRLWDQSIVSIVAMVEFLQILSIVGNVKVTFGGAGVGGRGEGRRGTE